MKNLIRIFLLLLAVSILPMQAQTTGDDYQPHAGTVAVGASANISNLFINMATDPQVPSLCARYYLRDKTAIRATFGINSSNKLDKYNVRDDAAFVNDPLSNKEVIDTKRTINSNYNASIALQQYFGESKLRGFVGIQGLYGTGSGSVSNTYANPMNAINPTPSSYSGAYSGSARVLENRNQTIYTVGGGLIAGFEYFMMPHLSIGAEISLNAIYTKAGQTSTKSESVVNGQVVTTDKVTGAGSTELDIKSLGYGHRDFNNQIGVYIMYNF
jgi:hypothetical protein